MGEKEIYRTSGGGDVHLKEKERYAKIIPRCILRRLVVRMKDRCHLLRIV
jgi:hypothetical protein